MWKIQSACKDLLIKRQGNRHLNFRVVLLSLLRRNEYHLCCKPCAICGDKFVTKCLESPGLTSIRTWSKMSSNCYTTSATVHPREQHIQCVQHNNELKLRRRLTPTRCWKLEIWGHLEFRERFSLHFRHTLVSLIVQVCHKMCISVHDLFKMELRLFLMEGGKC